MSGIELDARPRSSPSFGKASAARNSTATTAQTRRARACMSGAPGFSFARGAGSLRNPDKLKPTLVVPRRVVELHLSRHRNAAVPVAERLVDPPVDLADAKLTVSRLRGVGEGVVAGRAHAAAPEKATSGRREGARVAERATLEVRTEPTELR